MAEDTPAMGRARIRGEEDTLSLRQQVAARSYILGLERDRESLQIIREQLVAQGWEVIRLVAISRALKRVVEQMLDEGLPPDEDFEERRRLLLSEVDAVTGEVVTCPCGHSVYDHDEEGCMYLQCRGICA